MSEKKPIQEKVIRIKGLSPTEPAAGLSGRPWDDAFLDEDRELYDMARQVGRLAGVDPPAGLPEAVLAAVSTKRISWWRRWLIWAGRPRTVSVSPFKLAGAAAMLVLVLVVAYRFTGVDHVALQEQAAGERLVPVVLTLNNPTAKSVDVIGSFNLWNPKGFQMKVDRRTGGWVIELRLPEGRHEYSFLIDGEKVLPDPRAVFTKDDGFGNRNSVVYVGGGSAI